MVFTPLADWKVRLLSMGKVKKIKWTVVVRLLSCCEEK